ncbi:hypothetical protein Bca4012_077655 [Brassica carinata]
MAETHGVCTLYNIQHETRKGNIGLIYMTVMKLTYGTYQIDGRRVPVDVERGRTVPNWRPRMLGGGLGTTRVPGEKITGEGEQKQQQPSPGRSSRSEEPRAREDREKSRDRGKEREREQSRERSRDRPRESHREDKHHRDRGRERESRRAEEIETVVHGITIVTGVGKGKGSTRAASMTTMVGDLVREKRSMRGVGGSRGEVSQRKVVATTKGVDVQAIMMSVRRNKEVTLTVMISRATVTDMMIVSTSGQSVLRRMSMVLMADAIVFP